MKNLVLGLLAISLMSLTSDGEKVKWVSFTSELGKYTVKLPGEYEESVNEKETSTSYKVTSLYADVNFMVTSSVNVSTLEGDIDNLLDVSLSSFIEQLGGTIITQESLEVKGVKGIYASILLTEQNAMVEYKVFMHDVYHYQVLAYGTTETFDKELVQKYFKGFKILK